MRWKKEKDFSIAFSFVALSSKSMGRENYSKFVLIKMKICLYSII